MEDYNVRCDLSKLLYVLRVFKFFIVVVLSEYLEIFIYNDYYRNDEDIDEEDSYMI